MVTSDITKIGAVIFDGDDTLWDSQSLYEDVKNQFTAIMEEQRLDGSEALELLEQLDAENVARIGFLKQRFPQSMVQTYEAISKKYGRPIDSHTVGKLRALGNLIFCRTPTIFPETLPVLKHLSCNFMLVLATKGDVAVQRQRLKALSLEPYFDFVFIFPRKTEVEYQEIVERLNFSPSDIWVVGNSVKSDINPALRLGLKSVLVSHPTWRYEDEPLENGSVAVITSLPELLPLLDKHKNQQSQLSD